MKAKRRVEIGLSTCIFGKRPPTENDFRQLHKYGIRQIEICVLRGYLDPGSKDTIAEVCRWIEKYDFTVNSVHGPSGMPGNGHWLAEPNEEKRRISIDRRLAVLQVARQMGARYMVVEYEGYDQWPYWPHESPAQTTYPALLNSGCGALMNL